MEEDKMKKIEKIEFWKGPRPLSRYNAIFVALAGVFALHLGWWQLVQTYVPPEERPKRFEFLGKINSLLHRDEETKT